ncbi:MAG: hypothetical protein C0621_02180 [Desulfuromonas sp.]|nr:MAG: hypothetical protein C0621_02180 [Desulfuromonas sp.]
MSVTGNSSKSQQGFTLVELAVVILLISLFAVVTLPVLDRVGKGDMTRSARRLAGMVKYLYNESALSGLEHRLHFNLDERSCRGEVVSASGEVTELEGVGRGGEFKGDVKILDIAISGREQTTSGEVTAEILPIGWLPETVIHLGNEAGEKLTLRLNPFTGSTEVYEGYREF